MQAKVDSLSVRAFLGSANVPFPGRPRQEYLSATSFDGVSFRHGRCILRVCGAPCMDRTDLSSPDRAGGGAEGFRDIDHEPRKESLEVIPLTPARHKHRSSHLASTATLTAT